MVTDQTGGIEPVAVDIERNPGAVLELGAEAPPDVPLYVLRVGVRGGFGGTRAGLPVHRRENPAPHPVLKEIYQCEVAGKVLESANIYALREKVQRQLEVIAPARSLPLCYFRAPRYDYSLGVYQEGSHLACPVLAGPRIRARTLAEIREPVLDHLRAAGYLVADEAPEVLVLRPSDLRLVPPAAVIRSLEDPSLWLPSVEGTSAEGPVVGLLSHPTELLTEYRRRRGSPARDAPPSAVDISALLRWVGGEMTIRGRLANPWSLYAAEVRPEIWARTEELTDPTDRTLLAHLDGGTTLEVPVRHTAAGEAVGAIRDVGIAVFLAGDHEALGSVIGQYLVAAGFLRDPADLRPEVIREAPPERLDPDSIRTEARAEFDVVPGKELSQRDKTHEDREVETT
jgi:hypothetical protein